MDGFETLVRSLLMRVLIEESEILTGQRLELPGYFRPEKRWDLVVIRDGRLLAAMEFKSQVGPSFGNNFNNRSEEAIGNAQDLWTAFREGAFDASRRPWLGYMMLLEDAPGSQSVVTVKEPHFRVFEEFRATSYAQRYELLLMKLLRERLYDSACLLTSPRPTRRATKWNEPSADLSVQRFANSLTAAIIATIDEVR
jgi:hypothetical protein